MSIEARSGDTSPPSFSRPRLVVALMLTIVAAVAPTAWAAVRAVDDTREEIDSARLRLAQFAARQADRVVAEAFQEVAAAADSCASNETDEVESCTAPVPSLNQSILILGADGSLATAEPEWSRAWVEVEEGVDAMENLMASERRAVSMPFEVPTTGHVVVGLGVPVYGGSGTRVGAVVGLLDLTEPVIDDLVVPALRMGPTGHADLIDERGLVLASTNPNHVLQPGDHPEFYAKATARRAPVVEEVSHDAEPNDFDQSHSHVMAYAPLRHAPWGIAIGASTDETYGAITSLHRRLIIAALAGSTALAAGVAAAVWWSGQRRS